MTSLMSSGLATGLVCMQQTTNCMEREVHRLHGTFHQQQIWGYEVGKSIKIIWDRLDVSYCLFHSIMLENTDLSSPNHSETW